MKRRKPDHAFMPGGYSLDRTTGVISGNGCKLCSRPAHEHGGHPNGGSER